MPLTLGNGGQLSIREDGLLADPGVGEAGLAFTGSCWIGNLFSASLLIFIFLSVYYEVHENVPK